MWTTQARPFRRSSCPGIRWGKKREKVLLKVKKEKINVFTKDGDTNLIRSDAYEKQ